ncbi:hypothetical protein NDU88_002655 [Pleurodeles waltl]|uniref:Photolyase/cryptochrome alpha/beta domain-containing protein n=1 Tax=Pleurodeles waltl TaxID=8319 RepID=A0AAV7L444_PLEWA|nr:hypothetical protein NDU88_002655 [Pleurodeles waltl]
MALNPSVCAEVQELRAALERGSTPPDEFFCLTLSLLGHEQTEAEFPHLVRSYKWNRPQLHSELQEIYSGYFEKQDYSSSHASDYDQELDLALALSLQEADLHMQSVTNDTAVQVKDDHNILGELSFAAVVRNSVAENKSKSSLTSCDARTLDCKVQARSCSQKVGVTECVQQNKTDDMTAYHGQPEPEDCVLQSYSNAPIFLEDPVTELTNSKITKKVKKRRKRKTCSLLTSPTAMKPVVVWFRRDLRLYDNPALISALELGAPIIPVFLWCFSEENGQNFTLAAGGATRYWLHHALLQLNLSLQERFGSRMVFRSSLSCLQELTSIVEETGADTVIVNAVYEPWLKERDDHIFKTLQKRKVTYKMYHSYCLYEPYSVRSDGVGLRGIGSVTHFMSCCKRSFPMPIGATLEAPTALPIPSSWPDSVNLDQLKLSRLPRRKDGTVVDWAIVIRKTWDFSEDGAYRCLETFLNDGIKSYEKESGRADKPSTSHISPYLHFGQISPRTVLHEAHFTKKSVPKFLRKLAWRDLAYWLLVLFPDMNVEPVRPAYRNQRWSWDSEHLLAWQKGCTGYPLVDSAMRELWLTGWMNNYMRHVVASFLVAYLHIHWVEGYRWFQDTLVDADVAINAMMWQNGGMSGLDHWNFVMHPVDAALTCDPYGTYVRKWCPELNGLPDEYVHQPWKCPPSLLRRAGVNLGQNYPERIITDLEERRDQSLRDVVEVRKKYPEFVDASSGCDMVQVPDQLLAITLGNSDEESDVTRNRKGNFLLPVITRKEFKYKTLDSDSKDNPYNTVLKGYVSRKRDETIAYMNERHFTASTINEGALRHERQQRTSRLMEGLPQPKEPQNKSRRTPRQDPFTVVPPAFFHLAN